MEMDVEQLAKAIQSLPPADRLKLMSLVPELMLTEVEIRRLLSRLRFPPKERLAEAESVDVEA